MGPNADSMRMTKESLRGDYDSLIEEKKTSLPNFIIIGAAKSATTTLTTILPRHPDIFISKPKEPKFFGRYHSKGWDWYASRFKDGSLLALRGEASTLYASRMKSFRRAPELMRRCLPHLKLIYIVRHPLDRIVSQWRHYRGRRPDCADFRDLMDDRTLRRLVVGCSLYYRHLSSFREHFPDEQIHCMTFEDLLDDPDRSLRQMLRFLGVKPRLKLILESDRTLPRENIAGAKGRGHVDKPDWDPALRKRVVKVIKPDAKKMLSYMGKSKSYWDL